MVRQPLLSGSNGAGFGLPLPGLASDLSDWAPAWASLTFTARGRFSPFLRVLQAPLALMGGQLPSGLWGASPCLWPWAPVCHRRPRCLPSGAPVSSRPGYLPLEFPSALDRGASPQEFPSALERGACPQELPSTLERGASPQELPSTLEGGASPRSSRLSRE